MELVTSFLGYESNTRSVYLQNLSDSSEIGNLYEFDKRKFQGTVIGNDVFRC